jgi:cytochrome c biogenesis protein
MRTALVLLLLLALSSVAGSLIPQEPNTPERVALFQFQHPLAGKIYNAFGFFDVFGSWWFTLLTVLLFTSLIACLLPRSRAAIRAMSQRPVQAREVDAFRNYRELSVAAAPEQSISASRRVLRRRMFRVAASPEGNALAAEKGALREGGSLIFHWAFILVLVGVIVGKGTGYSGRVAVIEGQTWIDAGANYDGQIRTGRFFTGDYSGLGLHLESFEDTYRQSGLPMDFVSHVVLLNPDGTPIGDQDIRVNHPAKVGDVRFFQFDWGWAPVIDVRQNGQLIASGPIPFVREQAPDGVPQLAMPWIGILKLPTLSPAAGLRLELWPDSRAFIAQITTGQPVAMLGEFDPVIRFTVYRGDLTDRSQRDLDTTGMKVEAKGIVGGGTSADLQTGRPATKASDLTISFPDLKKYSVFQVTRDSGVPVVLLAAILILLGLLPALYTSRRKVWVHAVADERGGGTLLKVGGYSLQRKSQFDREFAKLMDQLAEASGGVRIPEPEQEKVGT